MRARTPAIVAGVVALGGAMMLVTSSPAMAADTAVVRKPLVLSGRTDRPPRRCGPDYPCAACPDGYSCAPLYGAYGPYGTVRYWGAYTFSGWDR